MDIVHYLFVTLKDVVEVYLVFKHRDLGSQILQKALCIVLILCVFIYKQFKQNSLQEQGAGLWLPPFQVREFI